MENQEKIQYEMYKMFKDQLEKLDNKYLYYVGIVGGVSVVGLYVSDVINHIPLFGPVVTLVGTYTVFKYLLNNQKVIVKKVKEVVSTTKDNLEDDVEDDEDIKGYKIVRATE